MVPLNHQKIVVFDCFWLLVYARQDVVFHFKHATSLGSCTCAHFSLAVPCLNDRFGHSHRFDLRLTWNFNYKNGDELGMVYDIGFTTLCLLYHIIHHQICYIIFFTIILFTTRYVYLLYHYDYITIMLYYFLHYYTITIYYHCVIYFYIPSDYVLCIYICMILY